MKTRDKFGWIGEAEVQGTGDLIEKTGFIQGTGDIIDTSGGF